mmetsp:Transcript_30310/g.79405  ORF Transcript_30310/g.79405 Transcript_30310/m.79405 type:complete len:278 (+) Transcript_30310:315-1148(+)
MDLRNGADIMVERHLLVCRRSCTTLLHHCPAFLLSRGSGRRSALCLRRRAHRARLHGAPAHHKVHLRARICRVHGDADDQADQRLREEQHAAPQIDPGPLVDDAQAHRGKFNPGAGLDARRVWRVPYARARLQEADVVATPPATWTFLVANRPLLRNAVILERWAEHEGASDEQSTADGRAAERDGGEAAAHDLGGGGQLVLLQVLVHQAERVPNAGKDQHEAAPDEAPGAGGVADEYVRLVVAPQRKPQNRAGGEQDARANVEEVFQKLVSSDSLE